MSSTLGEKSQETVLEQEARWAVRVLDAWAMKYEVMAPAPTFHWFISRVTGVGLPRWRIFHGIQAVGGHMTIFVTADEARIALAKLIVELDPELGT